MRRFFLSRILWFFPTLIFIIAAAFLISKLVPGDPILFYNERSASEPIESWQKYMQYQQSAHVLGLDQPQFYFSLRPYHVDKSFFSSPVSVQRLAHQLLMDGFQWQDIQEPLAVIHNLINDHRGSMAFRSRLAELLLTKNASNLATEIRSLIGDSSATTLPDSFETIAEALIVPNSNHVPGKFIPKLYWHGLDNQLHKWFMSAFTADFGTSRQDGQSVTRKLIHAVRWTLSINLTSIVIAYLLALPLGVYSGWYENSTLDKVTNFTLALLYATPVFWFATILIVFFSTSEYGNWTNIFPAAGIWQSNMGDSFIEILLSNIGQLAIPIITLSTAMLAYITRQVRSSIIEEKNKAYVTYAKLKGISTHRIIWRHVFRNASFPLITMLASVLPASVAGALVVEIICNIPGMGRLLYDAIFNQDWPVVLGATFLFGLLTMSGLLISDLLYRAADPRLRETSMSRT